MSIRIGLNGFGRIGRCVARAAAKHPGIDIVGINDLSDVNLLAHLLEYDSVHRKFDGTVEVADGDMVIDGDRTRVFAERNPAALPWGDLGVDIVLECTGIFLNKEKASAHLEGGAKKVIISAPGKGALDATFVMGVNHETYDPARHDVVSNASCTTNCLAPVAKVLHESFGIEQGLMTTIHAYTNDQALLDGIHKDWRRARAGALSMVPTTTGAAAAVGQVLPALAGKLNGFAMRVPTPDVSVVDLTFQSTRAVSRDAINAAVKEAANGPLQGILRYLDTPLVSMDFTGDPHSSIFDAELTSVQGDHLAKILSWYDNEWGYSCRMIDLALYMGSKM